MRNINVEIPSIFAKIEDRAAAINTAVLSYIQECNIEALLTAETRARLTSMGLGTDDVHLGTIKNSDHRIEFVYMYVYDKFDDYAPAILERFKVTWSYSEKEAAV